MQLSTEQMINRIYDEDREDVFSKSEDVGFVW